MPLMRLSVVVPAYNEEDRLVPMLRAYAGSLGADAELIVIVNGSTDRTADVARAVAADQAGIQVIEIPEKIGKGGAVRAGFARASGVYVGFADADLATAPAEFRRLVEEAEAADGAIASRWAPGARVLGRTWLRTLASRVFALLVRGLFGLPFADTQCGAKVFHRRFLPGYLAESTVSDLAFDVELLLILTRAGARITEVPSVWTAVPGSSTLASPAGLARHGWRMCRSLLELRARSRRATAVPVSH
jgi:glycosyltransferase involved in cell wall biosynthesis